MKRGEPCLIFELFELSYLFIKFYFTNAGVPSSPRLYKGHCYKEGV